MATLEALREGLPEWARDLKLNLQNVLGESSLSLAQRLGIALAVATATRRSDWAKALREEAEAQVGPAVVEDALAAAALMGMTNVFYRFRHLVGNEGYAQFPARLRMNRLAKPAGDKLDFELFCLAVSAVNACEACVRSHEAALLKGGMTEAQIHDAVRIAATIHGLACVLDRS